jgi:hypothetical protein
MAIIDIFVFFFGGCFGGALVWHFKDRLIAWYHGSEAFAKKLEAQAAALQAKANSVRAALK